MKIIHILAGESTQSFEIDIIMSRVAECIETFNISITSTACGVIIGSNNTSEVMIKDNASK